MVNNSVLSEHRSAASLKRPDCQIRILPSRCNRGVEATYCLKQLLGIEDIARLKERPQMINPDGPRKRGPQINVGENIWACLALNNRCRVPEMLAKSGLKPIGLWTTIIVRESNQLPSGLWPSCLPGTGRPKGFLISDKDVCSALRK